MSCRLFLAIQNGLVEQGNLTLKSVDFVIQMIDLNSGYYTSDDEDYR